MEDKSVLVVENETREECVELSVGTPAESDGAQINVEGDTNETGYETEVLGDEELEEDVKDPRDNYDHFADHTFHNNVTMAGTLRTKRWIHPHGCMFHSLRELVAEYPNPVRGMWAWVGIGFPSKVWICETDGEWTEADPDILDRDSLDVILNSYATKTWVNEQIKAIMTSSGGSNISRAKYADKAGYADVAGDLAEDAEANKRFVSRLKDDSAAGLITFLKGLIAREVARFKGGAEFGEFVSGLTTGFGGAIDKAGNAEVESLKVRSSMWVQELIINRLGAQEVDTLFSESDTIESVTDNGDGTLLLKLQSKYEGYFTAMTEGMVVKGVINDLSSGGTDYYTSWMRVNSVNASANTIDVSLYPDDEVPAGRNFPPCELMKIIRWGHQTDKAKQSIFYISSTEGRIVKLMGVDRPIIDFSNYEMSLGTLPEKISELLPIPEGDTAIYTKHLIAQYIWQFDHQGKPVGVPRDRGAWEAGGDYYAGDTLREETQDYELSEVWHYGCKWRCMKTGTTVAPRYGQTAWAFLEGNPNFTLEFEEGSRIWLDPDNIYGTLTPVARLYNQDVTADILDSDIEWTRYTEDADGVPQVASDNIWAMEHANVTRQLVITSADFAGDPTQLKRVEFRCKMTLRDGLNEKTETITATMI
ncbi:MAG: hypothetical protein NC212_08460 [Staphylococcus sp.]|nr:hypothetical protein [Staphylococcus sp.]